jgi:predicted DNA-binding transcriptional regulator AlpA
MNKYVTTTDFQSFKHELRREIISLLQEFATPHNTFEYLRSNAVCRMFSISPTKLRNMRRNNELPYMKLGRSVYFHVGDIKQLLEQNKNINRKSR